VNIKTRLSNIVEIIRGPYQKKEQTLLKIDFCSGLGKNNSETVKLDNSEKEISLGDQDKFPVKIRASEGKLHIQMPFWASLYKATLFGWDTFWNGEYVGVPNESGLAKVGYFEIAVPADGWIRVVHSSNCLDIQTLIVNEDKLTPRTFFNSLKNLFKSKYFFIAAIAHVALVVSLVNYEAIKARLLAQPQTSESNSQEVVDMSTGTTIEVEVENIDKLFSGRSIFEAIHKDKEVNFKADDLANSVKGLSSLFTPIKGVVKQQRKADSQVNLKNAIKSLQSGLLAQKAEDKPVVQVPAGGVSDVHWKSQFVSNSGGGKGLTESDQQKLLGLFAKNQEGFRKCYELALLKFEEMAVTVTFEGEVTREGSIGSAKFSLSGRYTKDSEDSLVRCLKDVMGKMKTDPKLSGVKVRNQFMFKS